MSEAKFTKGPWWTDGTYQTDEMGVAIIAANVDAGSTPGNPTRGMVAWSSQILEENAAECEANAHLIAAAPELYEACCEALIMLKHLNVTGSLIDQVDSALAKARGEV